MHVQLKPDYSGSPGRYVPAHHETAQLLRERGGRVRNGVAVPAPAIRHGQ